MIKLGNSDLGFTADKTALQRGKIDKVLSKKGITTNGEIKIIKQMIYDLIMEGRITEKEDNCQHYKRDGELTKPKTEYRLIADDGCYMELNRTEYDFANYILRCGFNDIEVVNKYLADEKAMKEEMEKKKQELEKRERQAKIDKEKQEKEFDDWLFTEAENYPQNEKLTIAKDIYIDEVGTFSTRQIRLLVLIDNFDKPECKEELKNWLSYYNKASLKTFYHITGINLGTTDKAITSKLNIITSKDFQGIIPYRKKPVPEGYKKFYKLMGNKFEEAYGEYMQLKEFDLYLTVHGGLYNITEGRTGVIIGQGYSKDEAVESFNKATDEYNIDSIKARIEEFINKNGLSPMYQDKTA